MRGALLLHFLLGVAGLSPSGHAIFGTGFRNKMEEALCCWGRGGGGVWLLPAAHVAHRACLGWSGQLSVVKGRSGARRGWRRRRPPRTLARSFVGECEWLCFVSECLVFDCRTGRDSAPLGALQSLRGCEALDARERTSSTTASPAPRRDISALPPSPQHHIDPLAENSSKTHFLTFAHPQFPSLFVRAEGPAATRGGEARADADGGHPKLHPAAARVDGGRAAVGRALH